MNRRIPFVTCLLSLALTVSVVPTVAGAVEEPPVLWDGTVKAADGSPAGGSSVVAYVRPPSEQLEVGASLTEVARTTAADDGRFTLRAPGGGAMAAAADPGGWTSVMVVATSPEGSSLAVDSLAWQPHDGVQGFSANAGRWITDPADLPAPVKAASLPDGAPSIERPETLVLSAARSVRTGTVRPFAGPSRAPGSFCMLTGKQNLGKRPVTIGHMHMEPGWSGHFIYTSTKSTSFEVGVSMDGGAFTGAGSKTMTYKGKVGGDELMDTRARRNYWYELDMTFVRYHWRCNEFRGTFEADTVEPTVWGGGNDFRADNRVPKCNPKYQERVGARRYFEREKDSGTVYQAGFNVAGFSGATSVATSQSVNQRWTNHFGHMRRLCGSTHYPTHFTLVRTES